MAKEIEVLRQDKKLGSSLQAKVEVACSPALFEKIKVVEDELRFILITSKARLTVLKDSTADDEFTVSVVVSEDEKCERCWHHRSDVGTHKEHETLCGRCIDNIDGDGEQRKYA